MEFLEENFLTLEDVKEIVLELTPDKCIAGPEEDRDGYEGYIFKFKTDYIVEFIIYIKFRYNPPDTVVCLSFHEDNP